MMQRESGVVHFFYTMEIGRFLLKVLMKSHGDRIVADFLHTRCSTPLIAWYAKRHQIALSEEQKKSFRSFRDFFIRTREGIAIDMEPEHLISPCDGWLSAYPIDQDSSFAIKGSYYRLKDILEDAALSEEFEGGDCLIFRLCASDYHHYCYIDDGYQGENHFIPGLLHSVQPIACETVPVYHLNRRSHTLLVTEHFGPVVQTEIGALIVGGIANERENCRFRKGMEKGHFELAGSTIVLLFQKGRIRILPELMAQMREATEARVEMGMWIGESNL